MSPPCRRAVGLTSGDHPERDPDLPRGPDPRRARPWDLRPGGPGTSGPGRPGPPGQSRGREVRGMPATPGGPLVGRAAELGARAGARGYLVLSGAASEFENDLPFSVFADALDEYVAGLEPGRLAGLGDAVQAELAHVFPSLSALAAGREVALQHERYRSHRAVRELLKRLAAPAPLVLVLDDLHWADSASVELLGALLRRPPAAAVLVAVALRPRQLPERLSAALGREHRAAALTRIELGALTPAEAREFLGETVGAAK